MKEDFLTDKLAQRESAQLFRTLHTNDHLIDFASNDYLGFARSEALQQSIRQKTEAFQTCKAGSTGSRLISGNTQLAEDLERVIARYHQAAAGLLFNSGYDANVGLFACIASKGDTLITDELVHASIIDGARLSYATRFRFRHNDLHDLEKKLSHATGTIFIGVESVYSMNGDMAPLADMAVLAQRYKAHLIVDEAHATGIIGKDGSGLVSACGLEQQVLARVHTFGKALGVHGAVVLGSAQLRDYLINFARSFIYTTALPQHALLAIESAYQLLPHSQEQRLRLQQHIMYFRQQATSLPFDVLDSQSPVQGIVVPGNARAKAIAQRLEDRGFYVKAILSPTVPTGKERLRICLHAFNTTEEIAGLLQCLHDCQYNNQIQISNKFQC